MKRRQRPELMDGRSPNPGRLAESLSDLASYNRYLGGTATIIHQLGRLCPGAAAVRLRLLDVGAGGADMLGSLARWLERRGQPVAEAVALELGYETVRLAAAHLSRADGNHRIGLVQGDARALPFPDRRFDVTISSTFLHHLTPEDAVIALREMARVSRLGLVVSDLRRGVLGYLAAQTLAHTVWRRHTYSRHDGPVSMRAAYTAEEARALARAAGLDPVVEPQPGFRWSLRWRRPDGDDRWESVS